MWDSIEHWLKNEMEWLRKAKTRKNKIYTFKILFVKNVPNNSTYNHLICFSFLYTPRCGTARLPQWQWSTPYASYLTAAKARIIRTCSRTPCCPLLSLPLLMPSTNYFNLLLRIMLFIRDTRSFAYCSFVFLFFVIFVGLCSLCNVSRLLIIA